MRVFITGGAGFVGSAVVRELLAAGHEVVGLARSDANVAALAAAGASAHRGDLTDLASLKAGAAAADGVIHCAFVHDFSRFAENCAIDRAAIEAMGEALAGTHKPLVITSGTGLLTLNADGIATEESGPDPTSPFAAARGQSEVLALALASKGVRTSIIRLPPSVHGTGDHGFVPMLIAAARTSGVAAYVGDGANVWPAVAREDAAVLYRLAVEKAPAGTVLHGVGEQGVRLRDVAAVIAAKLSIPAVSKTPEEAVAHFGPFMGQVVQWHRPASSAATAKKFGWAPTHPGLLADMEAHYF